MHLLTENTTVSHRQTQEKAMEDTYVVYTTITHPRTFWVQIFFHARYTRDETFPRVKYVPLDRESMLRIL